MNGTYTEQEIARARAILERERARDLAKAQARVLDAAMTCIHGCAA